MRNKDSYRQGRHEKHGALRGVIFLLVGVFLLLHNLDLDLPRWVISWQMLVAAIGLILLVKSSFRNIGGLIMIGVATIFMVKEYFFLPYNVIRFIWPVILISLGLIFIIFRPKQCNKRTPFKEVPDLIPVDEDYINSSVIFSGENRLIVSKNFKGGSISAIFGGCDINMLQADFEGTITLECECIFGGLELVVPSNWEVKIMTTSVFGGVEDKRPVELIGNNPNKVLIIKGNCVFGGIEIKSYA
jgi:predicted membrane protein